MKYKFKLFTCIVMSFLFVSLQAQPRLQYTYNSKIEIKQSASLNKLKNPFTGGFELPQFSPIDLNIDGILDLLIFDRRTKMFYTFLNDGIPDYVSYTYAPEYQMKFPECESFCLTYDLNKDGKQDVFMEANGHIQYYKNNSAVSFSLASPDTLRDYNGIFIFCDGANIPSFNDIDNDGDMDILTWDPSGYTIQLFKNFSVEKSLNANEWKFKLVDECWGKIYLSLHLKLGYRCQGTVTWPNGDDYTPPPTPGNSEAHAGSTLLTLDVDSDGDYEALLGDIFYNFLYFMKNGKKDFNYSKDTMILKDSIFPNLAQRMEVNYFPAAYFLDVDNDGKRDIILAPNDGSGASKNLQQIFFYKNTGTDRKPLFTLIKKDFLQETTIDIGGESAPTFCDIDNDGDDDMFIASHGDYTVTLNSKDRIAFYRNIGSNRSPSFLMEDSNFNNFIDKKYSNLKPCFGDLNGDGKKDLLIGEANGTLKYYENTSSSGIISFIENTTQLASFQGRNYTAPFLIDFNRDGKNDLFLGNYDGTVSYYTNTGSGALPAFTKTIDSVGKICLREVDEFRTFFGEGMSVPVVADLDKNGKFDLLLGGKYGIYKCMDFEDTPNDSLSLTDTVVRFAKSQLATAKATGLYTAPAIAMLDSDQVYYDIVLGNVGGGISIFTTYDYLSRYGIAKNHEPLPKMVIFPCPASNKISITGIEEDILYVTVTDIAGKIVESALCNIQQKEVDIISLPLGMYIVTVQTGSGTTLNARFVKM